MHCTARLHMSQGTCSRPCKVSKCHREPGIASGLWYVCREKLQRIPPFEKIYGGWWTTMVRHLRIC